MCGSYNLKKQLQGIKCLPMLIIHDLFLVLAWLLKRPIFSRNRNLTGSMSLLSIYSLIEKNLILLICKPQYVFDKLLSVNFSPLGCKDRLWKSQKDDQPLLEHPALLRMSRHYEKSIAQILLRWQVSFTWSNVQVFKWITI